MNFRFGISKEEFEYLKREANSLAMSPQDLVRFKLFGKKNIFNFKYAVDLVFKNINKGETFTLAEIYGDKWTLDKGKSGVFGKNFKKYISENPQFGIVYLKGEKRNRRDLYKFE